MNLAQHQLYLPEHNETKKISIYPKDSMVEIEIPTEGQYIYDLQFRYNCVVIDCDTFGRYIIQTPFTDMKSMELVVNDTVIETRYPNNSGFAYDNCIYPIYEENLGFQILLSECLNKSTIKLRLHYNEDREVKTSFDLNYTVGYLIHQQFRANLRDNVIIYDGQTKYFAGSVLEN